MTRPLISCIVPVYNGERYLRDALESIFAQTYDDLEAIVVDDGSTDSTSEVAAAYGSRVRYLRQSRSGQPVARNAGVQSSVGEFVSFLDADDLWHPEKLTRQMARFVARPDLDYCLTLVQNFWEVEMQEEEEHYRGRPRGQPLPGFVAGTLLAKREVFDRVGPFDTSFKHADKTEWFLRADSRGAVREMLPDVLMFRRMHPDNVSRTLASNSRDEYFRLLKATLDRRRSTAE
jgi:glycosyltransferase involved in cell wall biosynthesis